MRSRYTAYALHDSSYLLKTWHARTRPLELDLNGDTTRWLSLSILDSHESEQAGEAWVEFSARFLADKSLQTLRERSRFVRLDQRWVYLDGDATWGRAPMPGRNHLCYCGSGKKFKKCCG